MSQTCKLSFHFKNLEKEKKKTKPEVNRLRALMKNNGKSNKAEAEKQKERGTQNAFFEKITEIAKPPHR